VFYSDVAKIIIMPQGITNGEIVKNALRVVEIVKDKVDKVEMFQNVTMQQARDIKDQQSVINRKLDNMNNTLDANTGSLMTIEKELKGLA